MRKAVWISSDACAVQALHVATDERVICKGPQNGPSPLTVAHDKHLPRVHLVHVAQPPACCNDVKGPHVGAKTRSCGPIFILPSAPVTVEHQDIRMKCVAQPKCTGEVGGHQSMTAMHHHKCWATCGTFWMRRPTRQEQSLAIKRWNLCFHLTQLDQSGVVVQAVLGDWPRRCARDSDRRLEKPHVKRNGLATRKKCKCQQDRAGRKCNE